MTSVHKKSKGVTEKKNRYGAATPAHTFEEIFKILFFDSIRRFSDFYFLINRLEC